MAIFLSNEERKLLESTNECYMLGVLADSVQENRVIEQFEMINNTDLIKFIIKPISDRPEPIKRIDDILPDDKKYYLGIDKHIINSPIGLPISYRYSNNFEEKKRILTEKLENKLIVFKPNISLKKPKGNYETLYEDHYMIYKNLEIISTEDISIEKMYDMNFIPIPFVKYNPKDFDEMLIEGQHIIFEDYSDKYYRPEYVLCNDYFYFDFRNWERHATNSKSWRCIDKNSEFKRIKLEKEDLLNTNNFIRASDRLLFINENFAREIAENYEYVEEVEDLDYELMNSVFIEEDNVTKSDNNTQSHLKLVERKVKSSESNFIQALCDYTLSKGLTYTTKDLANFHICMKTNLLNIISGMTGTGKSQLARAYSSMLNLSIENENLLFMPISPNYTEPSDVIGYLNTMNGVYVASETGLLDFIIKASNNPEKMYVVIFDEMNLSQIEHWFAPFLSLLEVEEAERYLQLYSKNARCINDNQYPHKVRIGSNIRFIGTMNIDETTKEVSDRLLDRANIIILNKIAFKEYILKIEEYDSNKSNYQEHICTKFDEYNQWIVKENNDTYLSESELDFFDDLHELIIMYDSQKGVSFRVIKKISSYLNNIPIDDQSINFISRQDAIDLQIKQRIITKLKGTSKQFIELLGTYDNNFNNVVNSDLLELLESPSSQIVSHFNESKKEICRKAKEITLYGYTN